MRDLLLVALLLCALLAASPSPAAAQSITLTSVSPASVTEGDDFFTTVLNNPLDFDVRRDFLWEEGFAEGSITATGGIWSGQFASPSNLGNYVFPLFAGFPDTSLNPGRLGANFPLDSTKYTLVSVRSRVSAAQTRVVLWSRTVSFPDGTLKDSQFDGYVTFGGQPVLRPTNAFVIDMYDFSGNAVWTGAPIRAVRLDPNAFGPIGTVAEYDWVRISDPTSAPPVTIQWTTNGPPSGAEVNVYLDTDAAGFDGSLFAHVPFSGSTPTSFSFPSSALPPGTHFFYVQLFGPSGNLLATSNYGNPLVVNGKTRLEFVNPSMTSGPDYATAELGNPWDLNDASDIDNLDNPINEKAFDSEQFLTDPTFGTMFFARAISLPGSPRGESDSQVWMHVDATKPIDTRRYRYLTYQMFLDPTNYTTIVDKVSRGWFSRAVWWNQAIPVDGSSTKGHVIYEGVRSYSADLANPASIDVGDPFPSQTGWRANPTIRQFRVDMTETAVPTNFALFDVKLTGKPVPDPDDSFTIRFIASDPERDGATVSFFLDTDAAGFNGALLGSAPVPLGTPPGTPLTFTFGTGSLFPGDYWIYAVVTDSAGNSFGRYADVPMSVPSQFASGVGLGLGLNQSTVREGDTLRVDASFSNPDDAAAVDVFFGVLLPAASGGANGCPDGDAAVFFGPNFSVVVRCTSSGAQTFPALFRNVTIPAPLAATTTPGLFSAPIPAGAPPGTYTVFMLLTRANALADGRVDPADIVAVATVDFTIVP